MSRVPPEKDEARVERGPAFEFSFEGQPIPAYPGETFGAALMAAGQAVFRFTRNEGRPRGLFCGIGICYDCLVVVNGRPNLRACLTPAQPGADVRVQQGTAEDFWLDSKLPE
jgi:hypothetical protein